jgi:hypothetical protein
VISKSGGVFRVRPLGQMVKGKPGKLHDNHPVAPGATVELLAAVGEGTSTAAPDPPFLLRASRLKTDGYDFARIE